jgi:WD40 repeat protein
MPNYLLLYRLLIVDNLTLKLRKRICIKQNEHSIRSTFCPVVTKKQANSCLICTGSEDSGVYVFDMENDEKPLINKLQGHSSPVLDVGFNYDQSLLASGDNNVNNFVFIFYLEINFIVLLIFFKGTVIVWKTNNQA